MFKLGLWGLSVGLESMAHFFDVFNSWLICHEAQVVIRHLSHVLEDQLHLVLAANHIRFIQPCLLDGSQWEARQTRE